MAITPRRPAAAAVQKVKFLDMGAYSGGNSVMPSARAASRDPRKLLSIDLAECIYHGRDLNSQPVGYSLVLVVALRQAWQWTKAPERVSVRFSLDGKEL